MDKQDLQLDGVINILATLSSHEFQNICLACLSGDKIERDKIRNISNQYDRAVELVEYFDSPNKGLDKLVNCIGKKFPKIEKTIRECCTSKEINAGSTDVAILTVIPIELTAAKDILGIQDISETRTRTKDSQTIYLHGELFSERNRRSYSLALGCIGSAGNYNSAQATTEIIQAHSPKLLVLMGIAAGIKGKAKLGEVVFSERVVGYESAALRQLEDGTQVEQPRPDMPSVPNGIHQDVVFYLAAHKERSSNSQRRLDLSFQQSGGIFPTLSVDDQLHLQESNIVHGIELDICAITSGEKLLKDPSVLSNVRDNQHGRVKVGEMEAIGFATACQRMRQDWLVIRGVSDFGDSYKSDVFHPLASQTAAVVLADFLKYGLDLSDLR